MAERLPESLVTRFAVAARDVLWYKDRVLRVFERAGVSAAIISELRKRKKEGAATIQLAQHTIDLLEQMGEDGAKVLNTLFREVAEWSDLAHLEPEKQVVAKASQAELKREIREYANRKRYIREQERQRQQEREQRQQLGALDHARLQSFRERFDKIFAMQDDQARGNEFERLLNDIFDYYCPKNRGPFRRLGEQVDGHFQFDGHHYFSEIRWRAKQATAADVSVLRDRATAGFGGDVRALFISFDGFTGECLESLNHRAGSERVVLMDGMDLRAVLNGDIAFDVLLDEKVAYAVRENRAFVPAREIIMARMGVIA